MSATLASSLTAGPPTDSFGLSPSVYNAEQASLDLADSFLAPGAYSTLRSGFFGYMTGVMSRGLAEACYHRNVLYKEQFLNTCSLPQSIYNFAKVYEVTPALATPSSCQILIGFALSDLRTAVGSTSGTFVVPRGQVVTLGSTPFMLAGEVDIILSGTDTGGNPIVQAQYNLSNMDFPAPAAVALAAPLRTYVLDQIVGSSTTPSTIVYAEVYIVQAQAATTTFRVTQSSALENIYYDVAAPASPSQLAGFTVLYRTPTAAEASQIPVYFNESVQPSVAEYAYYNYAAGQDLEIFFSPLAGEFQPAYNSTLSVNVLSTLGSAGNFDFSGAISVVLAAPYKSMTVWTELISQPSGGADQQSLLQVKQTVQQNVMTRNSVVTETDLTTYLAKAVAASAVNGSIVSFIKYRDDVIARTFNGFLMMYDSEGRVVPTNTCDLTLEIADLDANGWALKPGTIVVYDRPNSIFRLLQSGEYPSAMLADPNQFVYSVPYLMAFFVSPYPRLVYFNNMADVDQAVAQAPGDFPTGDSFLGQAVTVERNSSISDAYQIDFNLTTSLQSASAVAANCIVRFVLYDPSNPSVPLGYAPATPVTGTSIFRALVSTGDSFDSSTNLILTGPLYDYSTGAQLPSVSVPQQLTVTAELYYNTGNSSTSGRTVSRSGTVFQLVYTWTTTSAVSLYQSLEQVADGGLYVDTSGVFHAPQVPLIGANYFLNPRLGQGALGVAQQYQDAIVAAFNELATSTTVSLKFYNTYGPSRLYNVDRVNLSVVMGVGTGVGGTAAIEDAVVAATASFVNGCNSAQRFSVSNLNTYLENNVAGVQYVQTVTINGLPTWNVVPVGSASSVQLNNKRVPEWLNCGTVLTSNLAQDPYQPDVTVNFVS